MITAVRHHDFSAGHRVAGHESKCANLHGHNYRVHFYCEADDLDALGRVIDFSQIKSRLCQWVEDNWDHKFLVWKQDESVRDLYDSPANRSLAMDLLLDSLVWVPFNPTAENMADYLLREIAPAQLRDTGVRCVKVRIDETRKCSVMATFNERSK